MSVAEGDCPLLEMIRACVLEWKDLNSVPIIAMQL